MRKGQIMSEEQKKKISAANNGKKAWNKGMSMPESVKLKVSKAKMGHISWNKGKVSKYAQEKHPSWKGDKASYVSKHKWAKRYKENKDSCEICKTTISTRYELANIDHKYSRDINDYKWLCHKCHLDFDRKNNPKRFERPNPSEETKKRMSIAIKKWWDNKKLISCLGETTEN